MRQFLMIALVAALLLFGCAGSAPQQPAGGNSNVPPAPPAQNNNVPPAPPANNGAQQPSASAFDSLMNALKMASGWKVSYSITGTGITTPITTSQYVKGMEKFRSDMSVQGMETRTYVVGKDAYSCNNAQGSWTCLKFSGATTGTETVDLKKDLETDSANYTVTADGTMQIAGTTASCYRVVGKGGTSRYCVSAEGVPLYIRSTATSNGQESFTEMSATSYSPSVSDADFALPATPQEIPSLPSGGDVCSYCSYMTGTDKADCLASCGSS